MKHEITKEALQEIGMKLNAIINLAKEANNTQIQYYATGIKEILFPPTRVGVPAGQGEKHDLGLHG